MTKKAWRRGRAAGLAYLLVAVSLFVSSQRAEATHSATFAAGDVFVTLKTGTAVGQVQWRHPDGSSHGILTSMVPGHPEGMAFDAAGNLYVAHWCADFTCLTGNTVERFTISAAPAGTFGTGYNCNPTSVVFDAAGNAYVGQADCTGDILKLDALGAYVGAYNAEPDNRGSMWIDLASDGCTILYTSEGYNVKRYNVCGNAQLTNFAALPDTGQALRILPDGRVLVAARSVIVLLDASGTIVGTYDVAGEPDLWFGLDIVGDGTFWAGNFGSGNVFRFDMATGAVVSSFATGFPNSVKAVKVKRAPSAVTRRGRMTGGGSVFTDSGMRVTHGFELHCDWNRKPNNLEINEHPGGTAGGRYHLEKLEYAECYDDPSINPFPPAAPFDTYYGRGTGRYNGQPGYYAEWIFTDAGEPGTEDKIRYLTIKDANGYTVLYVTEKKLTFGNHQAHK